MGKGDRKTRKGKIAMGSYGVTRPRPIKKSNTKAAGKTKEASKPKKTAAKSKK